MYAKDPYDRMIAIQMETPVIRKNGIDGEVTHRVVNKYDWNWLISLADKALEAGIKP